MEYFSNGCVECASGFVSFMNLAFFLMKVSVKVQDKDFTVRPVSPMYGSADLLCKGANFHLVLMFTSDNTVLPGITR